MRSAFVADPPIVGVSLDGQHYVFLLNLYRACKARVLSSMQPVLGKQLQPGGAQQTQGEQQQQLQKGEQVDEDEEEEKEAEKEEAEDQQASEEEIRGGTGNGDGNMHDKDDLASTGTASDSTALESVFSGKSGRSTKQQQQQQQQQPPQQWRFLCVQRQGVPSSTTQAAAVAAAVHTASSKPGSTSTAASMATPKDGAGAGAAKPVHGPQCAFDLNPQLKPTAAGNISIPSIEWLLRRLLGVEEPHVAVTQAMYETLNHPLAVLLLRVRETIERADKQAALTGARGAEQPRGEGMRGGGVTVEATEAVGQE